MIIDKLGSIFEERRKTERRKTNIPVDVEKRKSERRNLNKKENKK